MRVSIAWDDAFLHHLPGPTHPESPGRLRSILKALEASALDFHSIPTREATAEELLRVHRPEYLEALRGADQREVALDPDTTTSPGSVRAALLAAGASVELALSVARKQAPPGMALVRPPGHHALPDRAMGFCLLNNVAIAAAALRASGLAPRVAIVDFDVHHGNGTEAIFYRDPSVFYASTHQSPFYPGTGAAGDVGEGPGLGTNLNVPLLAGAGDRELLTAIDELIAPQLRAFRPDFLLVSAGFDAYREDPLGGLAVTVDGYREVAVRLRRLAEDLCDGRIAAALEGGYHLAGLGASVRAFLEAWAT